MVYITPSELCRKHNLSAAMFLKLTRLANKPDSVCDNCGEPAWKYGETGLCFSCTTGESDSSNDYELIPEREK